MGSDQTADSFPDGSLMSKADDESEQGSFKTGSFKTHFASANGQGCSRGASRNMNTSRQGASETKFAMLRRAKSFISPGDLEARPSREWREARSSAQVLESAAEKCAGFISKSTANGRHRRRTMAKEQYVPRIEAKVRRTWYTRRDRDGCTVLVQVEEGVDEEATIAGIQQKEGARSSDIRRASDLLKDTGKVWTDPFKNYLQRHDHYIHPHSRFMRLWGGAFLVACLYFLCMVPLRIACPSVWPTPELVLVDALATALLLVDCLLVRFYVAYEDTGLEATEQQVRGGSKLLYSNPSQDAHLVVDRARIFERHVRSRLWLGLLAALPLDLLLLGVQPGGLVWASGDGDEAGSGDTAASALGALHGALAEPSGAAYAGLARLACLPLLIHVFAAAEWSSVENSIADRVLRNLLVGAMGAHWLACGFVYIATRAELAGKPSHLSHATELAFYAQVGTSGARAVYARAFYWAVTTMSGVGYGDIVPASLGETVYAAFAVCLGTSFFLFTVGSVTSIIMSSDAVNAQVKARLAALKKWMGRAGLPPEIRARVLENFYDQHVTRMGAEDRSMLAEMPKFLQHEVAMYLNKDIVSSTALFRGCSSTLVASIVENLHAHRCLPLDHVVHKGDVADELYLVKRGLFEVLNSDGTVHRMLGPGIRMCPCWQHSSSIIAAARSLLIVNAHHTLTTRARPPRSHRHPFATTPSRPPCSHTL